MSQTAVVPFHHFVPHVLGILTPMWSGSPALAEKSQFFTSMKFAISVVHLPSYRLGNRFGSINRASNRSLPSLSRKKTKYSRGNNKPLIMSAYKASNPRVKRHLSPNRSIPSIPAPSPSHPSAPSLSFCDQPRKTGDRRMILNRTVRTDRY